MASLVYSKKVIIGVALLCVGVFAASHFFGCKNQYSLLNRTRRCHPEYLSFKREYEEFEHSLKQQIKAWKQQGFMTHASVYFRDLENGPWFGIDEDREFYLASLMKAPVMLALLKESEADPSLMDEELSYNGPTGDLDDNAIDGERIEPNTLYTIRELLLYMIASSDNRAAELIIQFLQERSGGRNLPIETLDAIGLLPERGDPNTPLTVKGYASLFRILFNASYLDRERSQEALNILSHSSFVDGLVAGVPKGTLVAHKFGIWDGAKEGRQLHDCGIVYHPSTPYLLCVMTQGTDFYKNADVIAQISELVYDAVDEHDDPLPSSEPHE